MKPGTKSTIIDKSLLYSLLPLAVFIPLVIYVSFRYAPIITNLAKNPEEFRNYLISFGNKSVFVFILFQLLQVVIAVIPGGVVQLAGGYVYGILIGFLYSMIGIFIGSVVAFYAARLLGFSIVKKLASEKQLDKFQFLINSPKYELAIFILFIFPGFPKDALTYMAGLTPIKPRNFFILTTIARIPGIFLSACVGSTLQEKQYTSVIILSAIICCIAAAGVIYKDKIISLIKKL